jgi:hypothetical protein
LIGVCNSGILIEAPASISALSELKPISIALGDFKLNQSLAGTVKPSRTFRSVAPALAAPPFKKSSVFLDGFKSLLL